MCPRKYLQDPVSDEKDMYSILSAFLLVIPSLYAILDKYVFLQAEVFNLHAPDLKRMRKSIEISACHWGLVGRLGIGPFWEVYLNRGYKPFLAFLQLQSKPT